MKKYVLIMLVATAVVGSYALTVVGENTGNTKENGTGDLVPILISEHTGATATNKGNVLNNYFVPIIGFIGVIALLGCIFIIRMKKKKE
jgi:hypothetical protein